jgi:hypothetical protein
MFPTAQEMILQVSVVPPRAVAVLRDDYDRHFQLLLPAVVAASRMIALTTQQRRNPTAPEPQILHLAVQSNKA